jgi:hypothetical protein
VVDSVVDSSELDVLLEPVVADDVLPGELEDDVPLAPSASFTIRSIAAMCVSASPDMLPDIVELCELVDGDVPLIEPVEPLVEPVAPLVVPDVVSGAVEPDVVDPVVEPVNDTLDVPDVEPLDMPADPLAEPDPPAALWNACRWVRNSSSLDRSCGSSEADAAPLVPTEPDVPVADVEPDVDDEAPLVESSEFNVCSTCE